MIKCIALNWGVTSKLLLYLKGGLRFVGGMNGRVERIGFPCHVMAWEGVVRRWAEIGADGKMRQGVIVI